MPFFYFAHAPEPVKEVKVVKIKKIGPKLTSTSESSRDFRIIIGLSAALLAVFLVTVAIGPIATSFHSGSYTGKSDCREMILGYLQSGMYTSHEQFRTAISYC